MGILYFLKKNFAPKKSFTRKAFRRHAQFAVAIRPLTVRSKRSWLQPEYVGTGENISPKGIQIESGAPLEVRDLVHLKFALREGSKTVEVSAIVRNLRPGKEGKRVSGLEFSNPSEEVTKYLATILLLYK
jgi:hypothetical protein